MNFLHVSTTILLLALFVSPCRGEQLSLRDCVRKANDGNPELRTASWDSRVADESVRQARSAWYPRLDIQGGYTAQQAAQAVQIVGRSEEMQDPSYAFATVAATYSIYDFGRRESRLRQAQALATATANGFDARRSDVTLQVIEAYFGILESAHLVTAAQDEITQTEHHRRIAQALLEEGVVTRNDVLQADVRLAAAKLNLLTRTNLLDNTWLRLNYLTGSAPAYRAELQEGDTLTPPPEASDNLKTALEKRPEILALHRKVDASEAELRESTCAYYPELYSRLGVDYTQNSKYREQAILSATVGLKINLFDGFATTAAKERAVKTRSRSQDLLRQTENQVQLEIDTARNDLRVATDRIRVTETAIRQSEENLRINQERYKERVGTATEVLDAQTLLTQTRTDYYRALFDRQIAMARLKRAVGEL